MGEGEQYKQVCEQQFKDTERLVNEIGEEQSIQRRILDKIREKVFNGFGEKIESVEKDMNQLRKDNESSHREVRGTLRSLMIVFISGLLTIIAAIIVNIYISNSRMDVQELETVMETMQEYIDEAKAATVTEGP